MGDEKHTKPGHLILELLEEHNWSQRVLATVLDVSDAKVTKIISGRRPVDAQTAIQLSEVFNVPAERFMSLQAKYDLAVARLNERPDPTRATKAQLYGSLPIASMIQRGWIRAKDVKDFARIEPEVVRFFGVDKLEDVLTHAQPHAAKKTNPLEGPTLEQKAWVRRATQIAEEQLAARYTPTSVEAAIAKLKPRRISEDAIRDIPRILMEAGIRFVVVETIPQAKMDGACFWLNPESPVVAMSVRYDRIDNFWFVLRHELEHVRLGHGQESPPDQGMLDADLKWQDGSEASGLPEEERLANAAAADFCVPTAKMEAFIRKKAPYFRERDLLGFARMLKVHPGLVAGQLQHRTKKYNRFRGHLTKVRHIVRSATIADGWGNVYDVE